MDDLKIIKLLTEFLPTIQKLRTSTIVIKYGGAAMKNATLTSQVIQDIVFLSHLGFKAVIVHGGGPFINLWLDKINLQTIFKDGVRVTDQQTMEVVEMVLSGKINKELVSLFNINSIKAVGLSGKDAGFMMASSIDNSSNNLVGKIELIDPSLLHLLINNNYLPIIAPIAFDINGKSYNINADTVAGEIASVINAQKLVILTDKAGILKDITDPTTLFIKLTVKEVERLIQENIIKAGMLPKVECCLKAISEGVQSTHIIDGRIPHSLILSLLTNSPVGSTIIP